MAVINKEIIDEPYEQEECIDYEQLKKRMWKDRVLLQKLKEKREKQEPDVEAKQEASRRKKMSRAQDSVLKYMVKIMEDCNAQGFVYGIIPEKGKPVSSYSDSLREWWKDQIRFDQNAPVAISKYLPLLENDLDISSFIHLLQDLQDSTCTRLSSLCSHATLCTSTEEVSSGERAFPSLVAQWGGSLVGPTGPSGPRTRPTSLQKAP